jgi:hypothetical protein
MDGSGTTTCPEKVIYSKVSTVSLDPHGRVLDPWIYSPNFQVSTRTPTCTDRTPGMGFGPPVWVWAAHSRVPRSQDRTHPVLNQGPGGGPVPTRVRTYLHTLLLLAPAETRRCHVAYCAWHTACGICQRVEPDIMPLGSARLCIHYG